MLIAGFLQLLRGSNRRAFRLHVGEPVWLGPAVATKEKESVKKHELTLAQLLRQVDKCASWAKMVG